MILNDTLKSSEAWMKARISIVDKIHFESSTRLQVSVSLLIQAIDIHSAIHTLVRYNVICPSYILLRPQFERYVRGTWFAYCASEKDIEKFINKVDPPKIDILISDIKKFNQDLGSSIERAKSKLWKDLNDLTHGGIIQIKKMNTLSGIKQNFPEVDIVNLLNGAATMSFIACKELAEITGNHSVIEELDQQFGHILTEYRKFADSKVQNHSVNPEN